MAVLRGFLSGPVLQRVLSEVEAADWELYCSKLKTELLMVENRASGLLHFVMHDRALFDLVEELTGSEPIGRFSGRTYRMIPKAGHTDHWHTDLFPGRVAAISVNLSEEPFGGGSLEIRDAVTKERISLAPPLECGDAVLLGLRHGLQHRVRAVRGNSPKTAFAGFFYTDRQSPLAFPRTALTGRALRCAPRGGDD